jgi:DnaJ-class molecular chaperone
MAPYFVRCSDCSGTGLLSDPVEPCVYCEGKGYKPERQVTAAERRAEVRRLDEALRRIERNEPFDDLFARLNGR